jgi:hypothetical protein
MLITAHLGGSCYPSNAWGVPPKPYQIDIPQPVQTKRGQKQRDETYPNEHVLHNGPTRRGYIGAPSPLRKPPRYLFIPLFGSGTTSHLVPGIKETEIR